MISSWHNRVNSPEDGMRLPKWRGNKKKIKKNEKGGGGGRGERERKVHTRHSYPNNAFVSVALHIPGARA